MGNSLETVDGLQYLGFEGFCSFKDMYAAGGVAPAPLCKGIYLVIWDRKDRPKFLPEGTGGYYRGRDPNVSIDELEVNWVEDALIIYVGANKAGKNGTLKDRINLLLSFGDGEGVPHYGGRLMWQIENSEELQICWKDVADDKQEKGKAKMLAEFKQTHQGKRPFANLKG